MWVFHLEYKNKYWETAYATLYYVRRETLELIHSEELTHLETDLRNNYYPPHFPFFYNVEIEKEMETKYKDIVLHITTMILPFSLREVSLHFLL